MKRKLLVTIIVISIITIPTSAQIIRRINGTKLPADSLEARIQYLLKVANVSGAAIAVYNNNKPIFSNTYGLANVPANVPLTSSSVMYAASFSKMVFGYIATQCMQEKLLHLDTPLVKYLKQPLPDIKIAGFRKGYHDLKNDLRYEKITARMCLTHTTGFPNWRWFEADKKLKIKFEPGTRYSYSGEGLYLLQFVIEQITGKDYETISKERVFEPFGMQNTSQIWQTRFNEQICYGHNASGKPYEISKRTEANAGGSMSTNFTDFTKFYTHLIQGKQLKKKWFKEMTSTQVRIRSRSQFGPLSQVDGTDNDAIELGYGFTVGTFKSPYGRAFFKEGHDEGWGHYCVAFPDKKIAIVIMTNNDNGEKIFKELLEYAIGDVYTPWKWENYLPYNYVPPAVTNLFPVTAADLAIYTGNYSSKNLPIKIVISKTENLLQAQATGQTMLTLQATAKDIFQNTDEGVVLVFKAAEKSFVLKQAGKEYVFTKE